MAMMQLLLNGSIGFDYEIKKDRQTLMEEYYGDKKQTIF